MKLKNFIFNTSILATISFSAFSTVTFYDHSDYIQQIYRFNQPVEANVNDYELDIRDLDRHKNSRCGFDAAFPCLNDKINSVYITSSECVILGRDSYFFNDWVVLDGQSSPNLGWFNNRATSYAVFEGPCDLENRIIFYRDSNGRGDKFPAFISSQEPEVGKFNDRFSSIYLPAGAKVELFRNSNYGGSSLPLHNSTNSGQMINLKDHGFNDRTSSYKIINSGHSFY